MKVLTDPSGNAGSASGGSLMEKYWQDSEFLTIGNSEPEPHYGRLALKAIYYFQSPYHLASKQF